MLRSLRLPRPVAAAPAVAFPFGLAFAMLASAATLTGCVRHDGGPVTTETRHPARATGATPSSASATATFSGLDLRGPVDVLVREGGQAAETTITVTADQPTRARVQTRIEGDTLVVELADEDSHCFGICVEGGRPPPRVTVSLPALRSALLEGSGDLTVEASGAHPEVSFDLRGSGDVRYSGNADVLRCSLEGSGDVVLRGKGRRLEARVRGSGDVEAHDFPVEGGIYEIEGSGDIATVVHGGDMSVRIDGSGDLTFGGQARITDLDVSGTGTIRQLGHDSNEENEENEE